MFDLVPFGNRKGRSTNSPSENVSDIFDRFESNLLNDFMSLTNTGFRTDIKETDEEYIIEAELPGLSKDDITLEVENDYLIISANNEETVEEERQGYLRKERKVGKFQRSFKLNNVNEDEIEAEYNNGILEINLPKEEPGRTDRRTIDIN